MLHNTRIIMEIIRRPTAKPLEVRKEIYFMAPYFYVTVETKFKIKSRCPAERLEGLPDELS